MLFLFPLQPSSNYCPYPLFEERLAAELTEIGEHHRLAVLKAPSLRFSYGEAESFAKLMILFCYAASDELFARMCHLAYQIWTEWNYQEPDRQSFMFPPAPCALDFPVAAHYANQNDESLVAEETRLV